MSTTLKTKSRTSTRKKGALKNARTPTKSPTAKKPVLGKREENRIRKNQQIKQAAVSLFIKYGIESVTIDEIVKKAEISKGNFYQYFKNKEDLVKELFKPIKKSFGDAFEHGKSLLELATSWEEVIQAHIAFVYKIVPVILGNKKVFILYLQENKAPASGARRPARKLGQFISEAAITLATISYEKGLMKKIPPHVSALAVIGAAERLTYSFLVEKRSSDLNELGHALASIILNGLQPD